MDHGQTSHPSNPSGSEHPVPTNMIAPATHLDNASDSEHASGSPHSGSTAERRLYNPAEGHFTADPYADLERGPVPPPPAARSRDSRHVRASSQRQTSGPITAHQHNASYLDHVVPTSTANGHGHKPLSGQAWTGPNGMEWGGSQPRSLDEKKDERNQGPFAWLLPLLPCRRDKKVKPPEIQWDCETVGARLAPTIKYAESEREKYAQRALALGWAANVAIGLQVLLGSLTTALSVAVTNTKQAQLSTAVLGGLATLVASYLARVRGSGEPELSVMRVKDLEHFIRDCRGFELDHGHDKTTNHHHCPVNRRLLELRQKFEDLLGNASGERKLSATGIVATGTATGAAATNRP
ncbi:hypothetical protein JVU11DRAFT_6928 [Chiua virens]|nr:hypothetical protein JVU11DRAFT_6928 [Chiua virens]